MLREAAAVISESEKPLGYLAILVTLLGASALVAYLLTLEGVPNAEAGAFGSLLAFVGLTMFYLAIALRRGVRTDEARRKAEASVAFKAQRIVELERTGAAADAAHEAILKTLTDQQGKERAEVRLERVRLEDRAVAAEARTIATEGRMAAAERHLEAEKQSTERAKVAPAMDPYYLFEAHTFHPNRHYVGVRNKGLGPAENVSIHVQFQSATEVWALTRTPFQAVLDKGDKFQVDLAQAHFEREPTRLDITVDYDDLTRSRHSKSINYTL